MFKRTIEFNVVKKRNKDEAVSDDVDYTAEDYLAMGKKVFDGTSMKIMKMVAAYVALDTARKVVVNRLSK